MELAKRRQKELQRKAAHETSGAEDVDELNKTMTSVSSSVNEFTNDDIEIMTDADSGRMYEKPVYVQDPRTGIYRIKGSAGASSSSHSQKESQASGDDMHGARRKVKAAKAPQLTGINQPLSGSFASHHGATQYPVPLPQQLRQGPAAAAKQGKQSDSGVPKVLTVSDWAMMCPTKNASSVTMNNMNLPMYLWGRLGELRAANAGICGSLPADELEARLRHIQTVLQFCMFCLIISCDICS